MPVISVRVPDEELEYLKKKGVNVSEAVRRGLHQEIHLMRLEEARTHLNSIRFKPSRPAEEQVREDRDRGH